MFFTRSILEAQHRYFVYFGDFVIFRLAQIRVTFSVEEPSKTENVTQFGI